MTANDQFFERKQAAAVLKHGILKRYSPVFVTKATYGTASKRMVYFDGYAGPGCYEDGSPGSPLLAARTARDVKAWNREMVCLFCEQDLDYAADLNANLRREAHDGFRFEVWSGDVAQWVDAAVREAGNDPMMTFLDPFGTALSYDTIASKILGRPESLRTELLLNFSVSTVWRIGGLLTGDVVDNGDQKALARLDTFFGDPWWRDEFRQARASGREQSAADAAVHVAREFVMRLSKATGFNAFPVPVHRRPGQKPIFLLVLFTRHLEAPWLFNAAVSGANAEWREYCVQEDLDEELSKLAGEDTLFDVAPITMDAMRKKWKAQEAQQEEAWVEQIRQNLAGLLASTPSFRLASKVADVYGSTISLARDKHVNRAWDRLTEAGGACPRPRGARLERASINRSS